MFDKIEDTEESEMSTSDNDDEIGMDIMELEYEAEENVEKMILQKKKILSVVIS